MAPARLVEDDPVTAEYNVYLTPASEEQILLLQYPNRNRERPYNERMGAGPKSMRLKPRTNYLEVDVPLSTTHNFNKYQGLKWGDALRTATELQNESGTFGLASGFTGPRAASARRTVLKDPADRETEIENDLAFFQAAEKDDKVMSYQTLGGQLNQHHGADEEGMPYYFVGAFRGTELHLSQVHGTVQMRPQFHHVDAEEQRTRIAASRDHAAAMGATEATAGVTSAAKNDRMLLQQTFKNSNPRGDLDQRQKEMEEFLKTASEEKWAPVQYIDEDAEAAYERFEDRLFLRDPGEAVTLQASIDNEAYLDAISTQRAGSPTRRRKRPGKRRSTNDEEEDDMANEM